MVNSIAKGKRGEREFAKALRDLGFSARRSQQYAGTGETADLITDIPATHFEVKSVEKLNIYKAMEQAVRDSKELKIPVVAHKRSRSDWHITVRLCDLLPLSQTLLKQLNHGPVLGL